MTWTRLLQFSLPALIVGYLVAFAFHRTRPVPPMFEEREDHNGDHEPDAFFYFTNGVVAKVAVDRNFDGKPDYFEWFEKGIVHRFESDENFDGVIDLKSKCKWGLVATSRADTDFNGIDDLFLTYTNAILQEAIWRPNSSVSAGRIEKYVNGVKSEEWSDTNGDGVLDERVLFDAFGNTIKREPIERQKP